MNHLEKKCPFPKIAQFCCAVCVENLDGNLLMHNDQCEMERLNCVRTYILWYFNAVEHSQYLTCWDNVCHWKLSAVKDI
jgi:hypothetical protein